MRLTLKLRESGTLVQRHVKNTELARWIESERVGETGLERGTEIGVIGMALAESGSAVLIPGHRQSGGHVGIPAFSA